MEVKLLACTNDSEQHMHVNDVIITGLRTNHKTFSRATSSVETEKEENTPINEQKRLKDEIVKFFHNNNITINPQSIAKCHTIGKSAYNRPAKILLQFTTNDYKTELIAQTKLLGTGNPVYVNEFLTRENARLFYEARKLKRGKQIEGAWTRNGKIFVRSTKDGKEFTKEVKTDSDLHSAISTTRSNGQVKFNSY